MASTLYSLRTDGDQYRITKFVDGEVESSYLVGTDACECPAGHRHTCRHRQMLPEMLAHGLTNTHWFWDFDRHYACDFQGGSKQLADRLVEPERQTFTIPDGYEAICDNEGRATGELRPVGEALLVAEDTTTLASPEPALQQQGGRSWRRL